MFERDLRLPDLLSTYPCNTCNLMVGETNALNQTTSYTDDADGNNNTNIINPRNQTTSYTFDAQGRVLTETAPNDGVTTFRYDVAGNLLSLTDPDNNTTGYTYDANNELVTTTDPLGHQSTASYNAAGELTSTTDADNRTINYGYDAIGEETSETWVGGNHTATYQYNAAGEMTSASDPYSAYTYSYDANGDETSVSNAGTPGVPAVTLSYTYDSMGDRTSLSDSLGGEIDYSYNADQLLTSLTLSINNLPDASVTFGYDAANRLTGRTLKAGSQLGTDTLASNYTYDNANELTNITYTDTSKSLTLANYTYSYNNGGELTGYQDNSGNSLTYGYDANGELTSATGTLNSSNYTLAYNYDLNGSRTSTSTDVNGSLTSATYSTGTGNEMTSDGTYNYTYDNDGNMTSQTNIATGYVTYYSWDYRNRLIEVKQEDNHGNVLNDEKFNYDVFDNRIAVSLNGTTQLYTVYDGANPYIDFNGSGTLTQRYLANPYAVSQFYGQVSSNGTTQWFLTDNINSIRQVVGTSGSVLDAVTYDPYGNILSQTNSTNAPRFMYTGGAYDSITGTYTDGAREDNPSDGRWMSQDPLGLGPDSNPYRYVGNVPTIDTDESGLIDWSKAKEKGEKATRGPGVEEKKGKDHGKEIETLRQGYEVKTQPIDKNGKALEGRIITVWRLKYPDPKDYPQSAYECHGLTFGGKNAPGGPFTPNGNDVPKILEDEYDEVKNWKDVKDGDIVVFYGKDGGIDHSGIISKKNPDDAGKSTIRSKNGINPEGDTTLADLTKNYPGGKYKPRFWRPKQQKQ